MPMPSPRLGDIVPLVTWPIAAPPDVEDLAARPRDRALEHAERDEAPCGTGRARLPQHVRAGELLVARAHPAEPGLDRVRVGPDVVAVQRIADLEPQGVPRAEPARQRAGSGQRVPEPPGVGRLARSARRPARLCSRCAATMHATPRAASVPQLNAGADSASNAPSREAGEQRERRGTLQREHRGLVALVGELALFREALAQMREIAPARFAALTTSR